MRVVALSRIYFQISQSKQLSRKHCTLTIFLLFNLAAIFQIPKIATIIFHSKSLRLFFILVPIFGFYIAQKNIFSLTDQSTPATPAYSSNVIATAIANFLLRDIWTKAVSLALRINVMYWRMLSTAGILISIFWSISSWFIHCRLFTYQARN